MNPLVKKLEERLLPEFEEIAGKIRREVPNIGVKVLSFSGGLGIYLGHHFSINCWLKDDYYNDNDNLDLQVSIEQITTIPRISADVFWGSPSYYAEAEFYKWYGSFEENGLIVTDEVLEDLYKDLPRLYEALFEALKRRKPADE